MKTEVTLTILERLIEGVHPITGEVFPADHVCLEADVNAALRHAMAAVAQLDDAPEEAKYIRKNGKLNAGRPWTPEDDLELMSLMQQDVDLEEICRRTQRRRRGVMNRWELLNVEVAPVPEDVTRRWPENPPPMDLRLNEKLLSAYLAGASIPELAAQFQRTQNNIRVRLTMMGVQPE